MKGKVTRVKNGSEGRVQVSFDSELLGTSMQVPVDLVVLATGMVPNSADGPAIRALRDANAKLLRNESETQRKDAEATIEKLKHHEGTEILKLTYRQGPDLPVLQDGFPDSKFICFPYESQRTGIYAAGTVRAPMDAAQAEEDASGAVMKGIQSIECGRHGLPAAVRARGVILSSIRMAAAPGAAIGTHGALHVHRVAVTMIAVRQHQQIRCGAMHHVERIQHLRERDQIEVRPPQSARRDTRAGQKRGS